MPWANFDDSFATHPKIASLSDGAFRLHVSGICYCARHLTDGLVLSEIVPTLRPKYAPKHLAELLQKGLWIERGTVLEIHDYLEWNPSRADVETRRERRREAGKRGAARRWE